LQLIYPLIASTSHDPEVMLRVLVAVLHLDHVPGALRVARERNIALIVAVSASRPVLRLPSRSALPGGRPHALRPVRPSSHVLVHRVPFGARAAGSHVSAITAAKLRQAPNVRKWAPALSGMAGPAPRMTRAL
jgi:hypothetical protein